MKKNRSSSAAAVAAAANTRQESRLAAALNLVLADTYSLMAVTHLAHWNVEGPGFFQLHEAFGAQYTELFEAADEIAERVRALGHYAAGGLLTLGRMAGLEEVGGPQSQAAFVTALITAHEKTIGDLKVARDLAEAARDLESQDVAIGRIKAHEKTLWMLRSFLGGPSA